MDKLIDSFKLPQLKEDTDNFNRLMENKEIERVIGSLSRKEEKKKGRWKERRKENKKRRKEGKWKEKMKGIKGKAQMD